jgi:hypothetical protein
MLRIFKQVQESGCKPELGSIMTGKKEAWTLRIVSTSSGDLLHTGICVMDTHRCPRLMPIANDCLFMDFPFCMCNAWSKDIQRFASVSTVRFYPFIWQRFKLETSSKKIDIRVGITSGRWVIEKPSSYFTHRPLNL